MFQAEARRIERLLYRIARSYLNDDQEAEDAVQDALIKAWEKRKTLRDIHQFKPWMTQILSNRCKDILRKRKRWSFFPLEEETVQVEIPETENGDRGYEEAETGTADRHDASLCGWIFHSGDGRSPGNSHGYHQNQNAERTETAQQDAPH